MTLVCTLTSPASRNGFPHPFRAFRHKHFFGNVKHRPTARNTRQSGCGARNSSRGQEVDVARRQALRAGTIDQDERTVTRRDLLIGEEHDEIGIT